MIEISKAFDLITAISELESLIFWVLFGISVVLVAFKIKAQLSQIQGID